MFVYSYKNYKQSSKGWFYKCSYLKYLIIYTMNAKLGGSCI